MLKTPFAPAAPPHPPRPTPPLLQAVVTKTAASVEKGVTGAIKTVVETEQAVTKSVVDTKKVRVRARVRPHNVVHVLQCCAALRCTVVLGRKRQPAVDSGSVCVACS